jgi:deoxyribodipyrimidine photo-lyase
MHGNINIVWFKRDLRVHDHEPLSRAVREGVVIPLYIVEPELWKLRDTSQRHWSFINDCLVELAYELSIRGARLIVKIGEALDVLNKFRYEFGNFALWSHEETGNDWTFKRDKAIRRWCAKNDIKWNEFQSNCVIRRLKTRDIWSSKREEYLSQPVFSAPSSIYSIQKIDSDELPKNIDKLFGRIFPSLPYKGGRSEGVKLLQSFLRYRSKSYTRFISKPLESNGSCSRLSPHIAYGTLSVREIEHEINKPIEMLKKHTDIASIMHIRNLKAFQSRLAWRCHFVQKYEQQPEIEFKCMHPYFEEMRPASYREDFFNAWKNGVTGYPLVDASMRHLISTGWINFRMRAMLVSFASYNLWLDWRITAPYLAKLFTDYEPGIHYSQFQMQSGVTGINTVRIYNPVKQSYDHDGNGKFIQLNVDELNKVSHMYIHEPWRFSIFLKSKYPHRIVDHETSARYARQEITKRWRAKGFYQKSQSVFEKLGSRNRSGIKFKREKISNRTAKNNVFQAAFKFKI